MKKRIGFIGSAGIPNRYGGFESFLEHCAPKFAERLGSVYVTCDSSLYLNDRSKIFKGVNRVFIPIKANGISSIFHDFFAFMTLFWRTDCIVILGVSGGVWFPIFKLIGFLFGVKIVVNVDGVEWRRSKFSKSKKIILKLFDYLSQKFSDVIVYDNAGLADYILDSCKNKSVLISYSGDHVIRKKGQLPIKKNHALTICRIEPENQIELLIKGALESKLTKYTIIGNWNNSAYGIELKKKYCDQKKLDLKDPIYNPEVLADYREQYEFYLHGHSVGGTNPSLVEMLFYDNKILCFDCNFNRATADNYADYFANSEELAKKVDYLFSSNQIPRESIRKVYTSEFITNEYIKKVI